MRELLFDTVANKLQSLIESETYRPGDRLPSLRRIQSDLHVSVGTALQAYNILIDRGLVINREKSGFFAVRKPGPASETPAASSAVIAERKVVIEGFLRKVSYNVSGKGIVSFFDAVPLPEMLPLSSLRRSIQVASRDLKGSYLSYEMTQGNPELRSLIARRSFNNTTILKADDVVITNGTLEAINLCLRAVTSPGDSVVVQTPCYYGILQCMEQLKLNVIEIPSDTATGLDVDQLKNVCRKFDVAACVLVPNFNNPNGVSMSDETKNKLASFARHMKVPIIEDDIYGELFFGPTRPSTIKSFDQDGWVLLVSSFSKTLAPGFRVGWCIPGRFATSVIRLKATTNVSTNSIVQQAIISLLKTNAYDRHLRKMRLVLNRQVALVTEAIRKFFPEGTKISEPMGGYVLWVQLPKNINALELQRRAVNQGINFAPGAIFSNSGQYRNYIRISCNNPWNNRVEDALRRLGLLASR